MKFFKRIWKLISSLWNQADDYLEQHVEAALRVTTGFKRFLESPVADVVEAIIPGDIDRLIRQKLIEATTSAVSALGIIDTCKGLNDADKFRCIVAELQKLPKAGRDAVLFKLAALITKYLHNGKMPQSTYDLLLQGKYIEKIK